MLMAAPPVTDIPLTIEPAATEVEEIPDMVLVSITTLVPFEELIAVAVLPVLDNVAMLLFDMLLVGEAEVFIMPHTAPAVEDNPVIVFVFVLLVSVVAGCPLLIPTTAPPAPEDVKVVMVLKLTLNAVAVPVTPIFNPVIAPVEVILEIVLLETEDKVPPSAFAFNTVTAEEPKVQLLKVFPVIVLVGEGLVTSLLCHPVTAVVPETVMFDKLLLVLFITAPAADRAVSE